MMANCSTNGECKHKYRLQEDGRQDEDQRLVICRCGAKIGTLAGRSIVMSVCANKSDWYKESNGRSHNLFSTGFSQTKTAISEHSEVWTCSSLVGPIESTDLKQLDPQPQENYI